MTTMPQQMLTGTRDEWLAARRTGITASDISVVLGLSPWTSPFTLFHRKTGDLPEEPDNDRMALGRYLEEFVCERFATRYPEIWLEGDGQTLYASDERPWQMATPDRLVFDSETPDLGAGPLAVLEAKTAGSWEGWGPEGSADIPIQYRCQALWQLDVMKVDATYVAALGLPSQQVRVYPIYRDEEAEDELVLMRDEAERFLDRIAHHDPPPVDWTESSTRSLKQLYAPDDGATDYVVGRRLAMSYAAAVRRYQEAERRKREVENQIRSLMGESQRVVDRTGQLVARRSRYVVKEHVRRESVVDRLTPAKGKKDG